MLADNALPRAARHAEFPDWRFAPNIGGHPDRYELENKALDQAGHVLAAMRAIAPWAGRTIVDLGCGTGYWLARYSADAARVIGIEPDPALRAAARQAAAALPGTEVLAGSAEHLPLDDRSADVVHARFAYFFPPGTDAWARRGPARPAAGRTSGRRGQRLPVGRVRPPAGRISASRPPHSTAAAVDAWWRDRGATRHEVRSRLDFSSRAELSAVLHIEFPADVARAWLRRHPAATGLSYGYVLFAVRA